MPSSCVGLDELINKSIYYFHLSSIGYVEEIYITFLEAIATEGMLEEAQKELKEMTPPPMNTMLVKESKNVALEKKEKRKTMIVDNVPPTTPCK